MGYKMNKARRHEIKMLKYKKRLGIILSKSGLMLNPYIKSNMYSLRSHGKPCSCFMCSPYKYNRNNPKFKKQNIIELNTNNAL